MAADQLHTMPLKIERLFSSMRFRRMRWDERGAYILLLAEAWLEGGRLPNDPEDIRRLLGVSDDDSWSRIKKFVLDSCFRPSEDGKWLINDSQVEIYTEVLEAHHKRVEAGRKGGLGRAKQTSSNAKAMLEQCKSNQNQSQNQKNNAGSEEPVSGSKPDETASESGRLIGEIVDYLNTKAGTAFRRASKATKSHVNARLREGYGIDEFRMVVDHKVAEWLDDPKMRTFLRPETLFGSKFESYLNAARIAERQRRARHDYSL